MRLNRLDLIKYGKFEGRSIDFPVGRQDFHLIVGPNEAGKSTLRAAILDLFFGIPVRSPFGFRHPLNELRLGASISNTAGLLEFHRAKALKHTLRMPTDEVLPDSTLIPFLGTADRHFFDQMYGLDHVRLAQGGNSILNAENDVGQVLFQSAAGVASLGKIRDTLMEEADRLWAPKKAANRVYYMAAEQLDKATSGLKEATVRTKVWAEANSKLESVNESLAEARTLLAQLAEKRNRFERVRRTAPYLRALRECEQKLAGLGEVVELSPDAAAIVTMAERELATAEKLLDLHQQDTERASQELARIVVDKTILAVASDIVALDECRLQYAAYEHDIRAREKEIEALRFDIGALCVQLEWQYVSDDALMARLPTLLVRRELGRLALESSGLSKALRAAEQAAHIKRAEIDELQAQLAQLQMSEIKPALRAALEKARAVGDPDAIRQKQQAALDKASAVLETALQSLGGGRRPIDELSAMHVPSATSLSLLIEERRALGVDRKAVAKQLDAQCLKVEHIELLILQFKESRHPTTHDAVVQARRERDTSWYAIKDGEVALQIAAAQFEAALRCADEVADTLLDDVEDATELQSLQQQLEREQLLLAKYQEQLVQTDDEIRKFDGRWTQQVFVLGMGDMPLENLGEWLAKRERALTAAAVCAEEERNFSQLSRMLAESRNDLLAALREENQQTADTDSLTTLCVQAENYIRSNDTAKVQRDTLSAQLKAAQTMAETLKQAKDEASADLERWNMTWGATLSKAGLPSDSATGAVEAALELVAQIEEKLNKVQQIRRERIEAMRANLERFAVDADRLAQAIAPELTGHPSAAIAMDLAQQLSQTRTTQAEALRLQEAVRVANEQVKSAQAAKERATASIKPLMKRAGVATLEMLVDAIARSDTWRALVTDADKARSSLLDQGDGLSRAQIEAEVDVIDLAALAAELEQINAAHAEAVNRQAALTGQLQEAQSALSSIGGAATAAQAEAQRQEALAQMSDAAERYVRVFTAGRLLRWSIDRYREAKQGPMLSRAGAIFALLTQGTFSKLVVDFEAQPMTLEGLRVDGKLVGVSGMSDGTRDQLYLALRLAALELHLEQATPLPFIADDLFINYDDGRSQAGFEALAALSEKTQVIFLSHHDHLIPSAMEIFGERVNIVRL